MKDRKWTLDYKGHQIVAVNRLSYFPPRTGEALLVDGQVVAENKGSFLLTQALLKASVELAGETREIEVRISNKVAKLGKRGSVGMGCHILIDNEVVGGDTDYELQYATKRMAREKSEETLAKGFGSLAIKCSLVGFVVAVIRTLFNMPETTLGILSSIIIQTVVIAVILAIILWRRSKSVAAGNQPGPKEELYKLAKITAVTIPVVAALIFAVNKFYIRDVDKTLRTVAGNIATCQLQCNRDGSYNAHIFLANSQPAHLRLIRPNSKQVHKNQLWTVCENLSQVEIDYTSLVRFGQAQPDYRIQELRLADGNVTLVSAEQSAALIRSNNRSAALAIGLVFVLWVWATVAAIRFKRELASSAPSQQ